MTSSPLASSWLRINSSSFFQRSVAKSENDRPIFILSPRTLVLQPSPPLPPQAVSTSDATTINPKRAVKIRLDFMLTLLCFLHKIGDRTQKFYLLVFPYGTSFSVKVFLLFKAGRS